MGLFNRNKEAKNQKSKQQVELERAQKLGAPLVTAESPKAVTSEQFRIIRTNIRFSGVDKKLQSFMVTSSNMGEGKSTVAANLAQVFAEDGERVLIVDADLRKPTVHRTYDLPNRKGLSTFLANGESLNENIMYIPQLNINVLTSGPIPPNPAELLGSKRMAEAIEELTNHFDTIIYDAPPAISVTDAQILSSRVDGVILVVRDRYTQKEAVLKAKEKIELANGNILGAVLNDVEVKNDKSYYDYYYGEAE